MKSPYPLVERVLEYFTLGKVLDLGVGEGRNALFLASKGFSVTGVDHSEASMRRFLDAAYKQDLNVEGIVQDIAEFQFHENYDIILSLFTLHFLERDVIAATLKKMKDYTKAQGIQVITVFTEDNPYKNFSYLFQNNELRDFYREWQILYYKERMLAETHGKPHTHHVAEILALKS